MALRMQIVMPPVHAHPETEGHDHELTEQAGAVDEPAAPRRKGLVWFGTNGGERADSGKCNEDAERARHPQYGQWREDNEFDSFPADPATLAMHVRAWHTHAHAAASRSVQRPARRRGLQN